MAALVDDWRNRISIDPKVCHGHACIKGTRVMVWLIVDLLANGESVERVLKAYPAIARDDIYAALRYASLLSKERIIPIEVAGQNEA